MSEEQITIQTLAEKITELRKDITRLDENVNYFKTNTMDHTKRIQRLEHPDMQPALRAFHKLRQALKDDD